MNNLPVLRVALLLTALAPTGSWAANKLPDASLLEFLGSVDAEGSDWSEYLEGTDLDRAAKPTPSTPPGAPAPTPAKPSTPTPPAKPPTPPPTAREPEHAK